MAEFLGQGQQWRMLAVNGDEVDEPLRQGQELLGGFGSVEVRRGHGFEAVEVGHERGHRVRVRQPACREILGATLDDEREQFSEEAFSCLRRPGFGEGRLVPGFRKDKIQERLAMVFGDFATATRPIVHIHPINAEMAGNRGLRQADMLG
jgi:hypothetical protein